ncbi:hypothetical protein MKW94_022741, partial [Papaver nudicaule]|nr:hypothetical protein [Papaver nudicaule]
MALVPVLSNPFSTSRDVYHFNSFTQPYTTLRLSSSSSFKIRSSTKSITAAAVK